MNMGEHNNNSPDSYRERGACLRVNENIAVQLLPNRITNDLTYIKNIDSRNKACLGKTKP